MLKKKWLSVVAVSTLALTGHVFAEAPAEMAPEIKTAAVEIAKAEAPAAKSDPVRDAIQAGLHRVNPALILSAVMPSPVDGVFLVKLVTGELLYATADGKHVFTGDVLAIKDGQFVNLTDKVRGEDALKSLQAQDVKDMIVYPAQGETKKVIYVFTDVDCGYCRKLHKEVPALNEKGVEVRYLAFPRGGEQSPAFAKMTSAWCAKDRGAALATLKDGGTLAEETCENSPVQAQYELGMELGVRGTPAVYLDDGRFIPGYQPAPDLLKLMGL